MAGTPEEPAGDAPDSGATPAGSSAFSGPADTVIVTTTLPSEAAADRVARTVVELRLAACAQRQGPIRSSYRWQGRIEQADEWYVHCKTTASQGPALVERIRALHPYEVPEIVLTPVVGGHPAYLAWVRAEVAER